MKKKDLIKLLEDVSDDAEVLIWNGFVGDFQDISPCPESVTLTRSSLAKWYTWLKFDLMKELSSIEGGWVLLNREQKKQCYEKAKRMYRKTLKDSMEGFTYSRYPDPRGGNESKEAIFLHTTSRGLETFDRIGSISY